MPERPKNAWLITWEDDSKPLPLSKVASILPYRTNAKVVSEAIKAVFLAAYPLTLSEKFHFGLNAEQRRLCSLPDSGERFLYGVSEYLYARRVKGLRRKIGKNGSITLSWTELPKYAFDRKSARMVLTVAEHANSYTEKANGERG